MATIQIREIPEENYEILRQRARRAGQSMQAYMRDQLVALSSRPSKAEALEAIETIHRTSVRPGPTIASILEDLDAARR